MYRYAILAAAVPMVAAHGFISSPPPRQPGEAFGAACGAQALNQQAADINGNVQGIMQVIDARTISDDCNLWLCKGFLLEDPSLVQSYTLGQTIDFEIDIAAPHTGVANVSVVRTSTNSIIGAPLIEFENYASTATGVDPSNRAFSVTLPEDLEGQCTTAGDCVLQWWWDAADINQTYESCVDFTVAGSGSGSPAPAPSVSTPAPSATAPVVTTAVTPQPTSTPIEEPIEEDDECPADDEEDEDEDEEPVEEDDECPADDEEEEDEEPIEEDDECPADDEEEEVEEPVEEVEEPVEEDDECPAEEEDDASGDVDPDEEYDGVDVEEDDECPADEEEEEEEEPIEEEDDECPAEDDEDEEPIEEEDDECPAEDDEDEEPIEEEDDECPAEDDEDEEPIEEEDDECPAEEDEEDEEPIEDDDECPAEDEEDDYEETLPVVTSAGIYERAPATTLATVVRKAVATAAF
ncbi:hypothetical protein S40285_08366 [Stachybotrys chlorohalonatus IBT 40285]|uniref:Chitin-binding type-4 domain-containing protein n=1 Tax=Stachybotrys chlorohalonatus (strain IBT 40285) TaxID=1283841 RepID=A0A084QIA4_STAC4|nr:hypothetical protein S40285_08366 [Stachybotrys chlorohalonata IBT 40285]